MSVHDFTDPEADLPTLPTAEATVHWASEDTSCGNNDVLCI